MPRMGPAAVISERWYNSESVLNRQGISDPVRIRFVADLVPEILADIVFLDAGKAGRLADLQLAVNGAGQPDISVSLRALPLYQTLDDALASGRLPDESLSELVLQSGLASAVS